MMSKRAGHAESCLSSWMCMYLAPCTICCELPHARSGFAHTRFPACRGHLASSCTVWSRRRALPRRRPDTEIPGMAASGLAHTALLHRSWRHTRHHALRPHQRPAIELQCQLEPSTSTRAAMAPTQNHSNNTTSRLKTPFYADGKVNIQPVWAWQQPCSYLVQALRGSSQASVRELHVMSIHARSPTPRMSETLLVCSSTHC